MDVLRLWCPDQGIASFSNAATNKTQIIENFTLFHAQNFPLKDISYSNPLQHETMFNSQKSMLFFRSLKIGDCKLTAR